MDNLFHFSSLFCYLVPADRHKFAVLRRIHRIRRLAVGLERDRCGGQLRDSDVTAGGDAGPGPLPVRYRAVQRRPGVARQGPPQDLHTRQRLRVPR